MASANRAAARRRARESERAVRYETVSTTGWCEAEVDLPLLRRQTREALLAAVKSRRRGSLSTRTYTGDEAAKHVELLIAATTDEKMLTAYRTALGNLREHGGFIVTADCDWRPPETT